MDPQLIRYIYRNAVSNAVNPGTDEQKGVVLARGQARGSSFFVLFLSANLCENQQATTFCHEGREIGISESSSSNMNCDGMVTAQVISGS